MAGIIDKREKDPTYNPYTDIGAGLASTITQTPEEKRKRLDQLTADLANGQKPGALGILADKIIKSAGDPNGAAGIYSEGGGMMPDVAPTKQPVVNRGMAKNPSVASRTIPNENIASPANATQIVMRNEQSPSPARHPAEGFDDVYSYAESLSPEKFKRFVDRNQDKEGFSGFGYVEAKDPKTGKMKLEKVISRPEERSGGNGIGGIDLSKATIGDLEAIGPILNAMEARKENAIYHGGLLDARRDEATTRKMIADEALQERKRIGLRGRLETFAPTVGVDEANKPIKAHDVGVLDMMDSGQRFKDDDPSFYPAAENLWNTRERWIMDRLKEKKLPYNPNEINTKGSVTNKNREILKSKYRELLLKKYQPVL